MLIFFIIYLCIAYYRKSRGKNILPFIICVVPKQQPVVQQIAADSFYPVFLFLSVGDIRVQFYKKFPVSFFFGSAKEYLSEHPDRKAFVLDTLSTGPESELIVEKCRELTESGLGFETVKEKIIMYSRHTHLFFSPESLSNFAKNGRVSTALAVAASFFGIRIVGKASDKGELEPLHKCRGEKRAIGQLWECMLKSGYSGGKVRIRHSGNPNAADILAQQIKNSFPNADIKIGENRGLCSYYAEKGGILIGFES